jgi:catalase
VAQHPEAIHMVTWLKSPWGIPANYREMEGSVARLDVVVEVTRRVADILGLDLGGLGRGQVAHALLPEDQFPLLPVGRMVLDRVPDNFFAEVEQSAFGTGVLVDGMSSGRRAGSNRPSRRTAAR